MSGDEIIARFPSDERYPIPWRVWGNTGDYNGLVDIGSEGDDETTALAIVEDIELDLAELIVAAVNSYSPPAP